MEEAVAVLFIFGMILGSCAGCGAGKSEERQETRNKMIELNLAHYDQKTGKYVQDSISCVNDSCVIVRKNGE